MVPLKAVFKVVLLVANTKYSYTPGSVKVWLIKLFLFKQLPNPILKVYHVLESPTVDNVLFLINIKVSKLPEAEILICVPTVVSHSE